VFSGRVAIGGSRGGGVGGELLPPLPPLRSCLALAAASAPALDDSSTGFVNEVNALDMTAAAVAEAATNVGEAGMTTPPKGLSACGVISPLVIRLSVPCKRGIACSVRCVNVHISVCVCGCLFE